MNIKIIMFFLLLLCQSCKYKQNPHIAENHKTLTDVNLPLLDSFAEKKSKVEVICNSNSKLVVETTYINVDDSISAYMPLILNQELVFHIDGIKPKSVSFPFRQSEIQLNEKLVKVYNTTICDIKCLDSKEGNWLYKIYGSYNFDPPHEFFGLISPEGEWLWYFYGDRYDTYKSYGSQEKYIKKYGEEQINSLKNMKNVCPK